MSIELSTEIGARFEEEVKRLGGATQVAQWIDVSRNTVGNWFRTAMITAPDLATLGEHGMDVLWVLTGIRNKSRDQAYPLNPAVPAMERVAVRYGETYAKVNPSDYAWVPFFDIAVAGGSGAEVLSEEPKTWNAWRKEYLLRHGLVADELAEFSVRGDSMSPELNPGDTVLVDRRFNSAVDEDLYVLRIDNTLLVKYARQERDGRLILRSVNSGAYPDREIRPEEDGDLGYAVIGRVVRQGRDR